MSITLTNLGANSDDPCGINVVGVVGSIPPLTVSPYNPIDSPNPPNIPDNPAIPDCIKLDSIYSNELFCQYV